MDHVIFDTGAYVIEQMYHVIEQMYRQVMFKLMALWAGRHVVGVLS